MGGINFKLPDELHQELKVIAVNKHLTFYGLIVNVLQDYAKKEKKESKAN